MYELKNVCIHMICDIICNCFKSPFYSSNYKTPLSHSLIYFFCTTLPPTPRVVLLSRCGYLMFSLSLHNSEYENCFTWSNYSSWVFLWDVSAITFEKYSSSLWLFWEQCIYLQLLLDPFASRLQRRPQI